MTGRCQTRTRRYGRTGSPASRPPSSIAADVDYLAVVARVDGDLGTRARLAADRLGIERTPQSSLDATVPLSRVTFDDVEAEVVVEPELAEAIIDRLVSVGGLLAAAEAVGAAEQDLRASAAGTPPSAGSSGGRSAATRPCAT